MGSKQQQPAARLSDIDTGHPPSPPTPVITGSVNVLINSMPAGRQGDMLVPHHPGVRLINEGSSSVLINGQPAARVTDAINCGGVLITGSANVLIGDSPKQASPTPIKRLNIEFPNRPNHKSTPPPVSSEQTTPQVKTDTVTYTNKSHNNDTNVHIDPMTASKTDAIAYWDKAERDAGNFPAALGARVMRLNAEAGYSVAEGIAGLYGTLTNWDKFKAAAEGMYNTVTNPKETFNALKQSAQEFADLPTEQQGEAAYKMLVGSLAGGALAKAGKLAKTGNTKQSLEIDKKLASKRFLPTSLVEAQQRLTQRRKQIQAEGYEPKYSDEELYTLAQQGDVGGERFQVRFMETRYLAARETPNEHLSGALGMTMQGATGKGAKYWSSSFDQIEDADTDPKLIAEKLGLEYNANTDYALIIVDTEKAAPLTGVKSVSATFDNVAEFANTELPKQFPKSFTEKAMTPEFQAEYAAHYNAAVAQKFLKDKWSKNTNHFEKYLNTTGMSEPEIDEMILRMEMHDKIGNNQDYLGNGLTKDINTTSPNKFGAVETLNFERREINLHQLSKANAITVLPGLKQL
jgi:uncharacterized Zn-binding protein involved in type VI secretion